MLIRTALSLTSPANGHGRLSIFIFHRVHADSDPIFPDEPDEKRFDEIMQWIKEWFNVLSLDEAVSRLIMNSLPARAAAITFDDGYADNLLHATPILKKHGLPATFFIATGFLDGGIMWNDVIIESIRSARPSHLDLCFLGLGTLPVATNEEKRQAIEQVIRLVKHQPGVVRQEVMAQVRDACAGDVPHDLMLTSKQLRELRQHGMGIGAHTVSHPILAKLDEKIAAQEIADSRDFLEGLLGEKIPLFAYPNGKLGADYTAVHAEIANKLGFQAAVSTNWGVCSQRSDLYQLPRFTPWDRVKWRFGLRCLANFRQPDHALTAA